MKQLYVKIIIVIVAVVFSMTACHTNVIDETVEGSESRKENFSGRINIANANLSWDDCNVTTLLEEAQLVDGTFKINAYVNEKTQTFIVGDNTNTYLMSRTPLQTGQNIEIDAKSTAIAMVTLHPLFSPVGKEDYQALVSMITSCPHYNTFYNEVEKAINNKLNLYDDSNNNLLLAFSDLMEDICGEPSDDETYDGELDPIAFRRSVTRINTRAIYENSQINPDYINAQINGTTLTLRAVWVTPSYYGTIQYPSGTIENSCIPSRSDFGVMDLFLKRTTFGEPIEFKFPLVGEYKFKYSRMNTEATLDFYMRIAGTILSAAGLEFQEKDQEVVKIAKAISNAITAAGSSISDGQIDPMVWFGIAWDAGLTGLSEYGHRPIANFAKTIAQAFNFYNKLKGSVNFGLRIGYALIAPETMNFCLCCYDGKVSTCTEASIIKVKGDEQTGYAKQKLFLPLTVFVTTTEDNNYTEPSSYHRIKFEVISGGGKVSAEEVVADNTRQASTYWTLGQSGAQKVKATVIDIITNKEISEPVYFIATIEKAEVTIRLEWNKHSGNTDIDLHVFDPFGEEIAFYNMASASGGYLDRDDVVGPGPEHIHWDNAPAGTYKIYVHYYPNEEEDRSVTNYKVSVTANQITYRPKTGSIAYDQLVPIGQFTIGDSPIRSISSKVLDETECISKKVYPKK